MGQVLYRKYRSKSLDEVVGQDHITTSLKHALKSGKIAHAYLFSGPRGVGKTSVARILAYAVNDLPYDSDNHLDIIEIDAASNRRIDEIRDLRDKVNIAPTSAKYKVYIIDEVHMLTREAFNALLKTLEEPPQHVIFILATTEAYKLPETIVSRTQRYSFKPVDKQKMIGHLKNIAKKEKITIDDDALSLIADHGEGSFRDSISLLDQLRHQDRKVTLKDVQTALGIAPLEAVDSLLGCVLSSDINGLNKSLQSLFDQGYQATTLAKQISETLRTQLLKQNLTFDPSTTLNLLRQLLEVSVSPNPERLLEIILLDFAFDNSQTVPKPQAKVPEVAEKTTSKPSAQSEEKTEEIVLKGDLQPGSQAFDQAIWPQLQRLLKAKHNTLYSFLRMARPEFSDSELTLHFAFKFHQQRINESKNKQAILDAIYELTGKNVTLICLFTPGTVPADDQNDTDSGTPEKVAAKPDPSLDTITNIFGGGEVLES